MTATSALVTFAFGDSVVELEPSTTPFLRHAATLSFAKSETWAPSVAGADCGALVLSKSNLFSKSSSYVAVQFRFKGT